MNMNIPNILAANEFIINVAVSIMAGGMIERRDRGAVYRVASEVDRQSRMKF